MSHHYMVFKEGTSDFKKHLKETLSAFKVLHGSPPFYELAHMHS